MKEERTESKEQERNETKDLISFESEPTPYQKFYDYHKITQTLGDFGSELKNKRKQATCTDTPSSSVEFLPRRPSPPKPVMSRK